MEKTDWKGPVATIFAAIVGGGATLIASHWNLIKPSEQQVELSKIYQGMRAEFQEELKAQRKATEDWQRKADEYQEKMRACEAKPPNATICPAVPDCPELSASHEVSATPLSGAKTKNESKTSRLEEVLIGEWRGISNKNGKAGITFIFRRAVDGELIADVAFYPVPDNLTVTETRHKATVAINETTGIVTVSQDSPIGQENGLTTRVGTISEDGQLFQGIAGNEPSWSFQAKKQR